MSRSGGSNFSNNSDASVHGGIEPSTRVGSSANTPSIEVERSVTAISRSGTSTPPADSNGTSFSHKPLAQFSDISGVLINGLLGLANNFLKKKLIGKDTLAETESAAIAGALFAKQVTFNKVGGLIGRSDIVFEDVELSQDEKNILAKNGITGHGNNLHAYLEKEMIKKYIKDHVDKDYVGVFLGEEKANGETEASLVDSVFTLVELLTRPVEILEHEKKVAKQYNRAPRLSETDLSVNTAKNAIDRQVKSLLHKKGKTTKAEEIKTASSCIQKAVQVINIIYAEKGKEAAGEEKITQLRKEIETLSTQEVTNKEEIAKLQANIEFQQSELDKNKEEIDAKNKTIFEKTQALEEAKETHNRLIGEVSEAHSLNLKLNGSIIDKDKEATKLKSQIISLESDIATANNAVTALTDKNSGLVTEIHAKKIEAEKLAAKVHELDEKLKKTANSQVTAENENQKLTQKVEAQAKTIQELTITHQTTTHKSHEYQVEIKANNDAISQLQKEKQTLGHTIKEQVHALTELESQNKTLGETVAEKGKTIVDLNKKNQSVLDAVSKLETQIEQNKQAITALQNEKESLSVAVNEKDHANNSLTAQNKTLTTEIDRMNDEIQALNKANQSAQDQIKSLLVQAEVNVKVIASLKKEKQDLTQDLAKKAESYAELEFKLDSLTSTLTSKSTEIATLNEANQKAQHAIVSLQNEAKSLTSTVATHANTIVSLENTIKEKSHDKIAQQNELAKQLLALQEFKEANEKLANQIEEINQAHAVEKDKLEKIGVGLASQNEELAQKANVQHNQDFSRINELKAVIAEKDEVIVNLQNEHKAPVVDQAQAAASNPVNRDEMNRILAENAALRAYITNQNQSIQQNLNHMRTASSSSWLKWLAVGLVTAIGVGLIATGFGALAGIGLIAGAALVATGALAITGTAAKVAYDHAHAGSTILQDIQATEAALVEPVIQAEPIQHINHLLANHAADNNKQEEIVFNANVPLVADAALYQTSSSSHGSFLNFGRSNKVAPLPLPAATAANINASPSP